LASGTFQGIRSSGPGHRFPTGIASAERGRPPPRSPPPIAISTTVHCMGLSPGKNQVLATPGYGFPPVYRHALPPPPGGGGGRRPGGVGVQEGNNRYLLPTPNVIPTTVHCPGHPGGRRFSFGQHKTPPHSGFTRNVGSRTRTSKIRRIAVTHAAGAPPHTCKDGPVQ
jgi:hypothetical protein